MALIWTNGTAGRVAAGVQAFAKSDALEAAAAVDRRTLITCTASQDLYGYYQGHRPRRHAWGFNGAASRMRRKPDV